MPNLPIHIWPNCSWSKTSRIMLIPLINYMLMNFLVLCAPKKLSNQLRGHAKLRWDHIYAGVHVPDPGSGGGVGGATVPGVQRRQGGDVERGVRRLRWILPAGEDVGGHHLRLRCLLHPPLPHLLLPPLQRLRPTPAFPRQQGRRDRRLPPLIAAAAGDEEEDDHPDDHHHHDIPSY